MTGLARAVRTVVRTCLAVAPGEDVLVVVDEPLQDVGEALRREAQDAQADAVLAVMSVRENHGVEPPPPIAAALRRVRRLHRARVALALAHAGAQARHRQRGPRRHHADGHRRHARPAHGRRLRASCARRSRAVADLLARPTRRTSPARAGPTCASTSPAARASPTTATSPRRASFGNLPCGEGFIAPAGGEGTVVTRSLASIGLVQGHPAHLTVKGGRLTQATGPEGERLYELLTGAGERGTNLAELGVGTNERARLTGNILEDEKMLGTVHVAFGASAGIGGTVSVPIHLDVVVTDATLAIGDTTVLDAGRYVL